MVIATGVLCVSVLFRPGQDKMVASTDVEKFLLLMLSTRAITVLPFNWLIFAGIAIADEPAYHPANAAIAIVNADRIGIMRK